MSNAETIAKLNDALSKLIKAYEELQEENNGLNKTINELETKVDDLETNVLELEEEKSNLESNLNELNQYKKEDGSSITTMLGKIENLLGRKSNESSSTSSVSIPNETVESKSEELVEPNLLDSKDDEEIKLEETKEEISVSETKTSLDDIRLDKPEPKTSSFGNSSSSFGANTFNSSFPDVNSKKDDDEEDEGNSTLDLNRMASLLNGMNKR